MPVLKFNGVEVYHNDGSTCGGSPWSTIHVANRDRKPHPVSVIAARETYLKPDSISLAIHQLDADKNYQDFTGMLHLTKMEALALSHQLRKLAIGV